jgi:hypothetical protein
MRVHTLPVVAMASSLARYHPSSRSAARQEVVAQGAFQIKEILERAWSHHATAANCDMSGGNNWQQIACWVPCWLN